MTIFSPNKKEHGNTQIPRSSYLLIHTKSTPLSLSTSEVIPQ